MGVECEVNRLTNEYDFPTLYKNKKNVWTQWSIHFSLVDVNGDEMKICEDYLNGKIPVPEKTIVHIWTRTGNVVGLRMKSPKILFKKNTRQKRMNIVQEAMVQSRVKFLKFVSSGGQDTIVKQHSPILKYVPEHLVK